MAYEPLKPETQEQYLKIWTHFCIAHFNKRQLAELFQVSEDTVANAVHWAATNRAKFESFIFAEAAKEALEVRLRDLNSDIARIKESNPINWNAITGLYKVVQETEKMLWKFQCLIRDVNIIEISPPYNPMIEWAHNITKEINESCMTKEELGIVAGILRKSAERKRQKQYSERTL